MTQLKILQFPASWNGSVKCDPDAFRGTGIRCAVVNCQNRFDETKANYFFCTCHRYCSPHCGASVNNVHCRLSAAEGKISMPQVIAPFVGQSISNEWTQQIMQDTRRKLNGLDPVNGLGVLHGILIISDDVALLKQMLEIGVDPELRFLYSGSGSPVSDLLDAEDAKLLNGGTAAHFAAHLGRAECFQALLDCGARVNVKTMGGKTVNNLVKDLVLGEILAAAEKIGPKSLACLAKEGKFFALLHRMRAGKVSDEDLNVTCDGKTVVHWIWTAMTQWNFSVPIENDSLLGFKLMSEFKYRYGVDGSELPAPPEVNGAFSVTGTGSCSAKLESLMEKQVEIQTEMLNQLKTLMEYLAAGALQKTGGDLHEPY